MIEFSTSFAIHFNKDIAIASIVISVAVAFVAYFALAKR